MILSKNQLVENIRDSLPDNTNGEISPRDIRESLLNLVDSLPTILSSTNLNTANFSTLPTRTTKAGDNSIIRISSTQGYSSQDNSAFGHSALSSNYRSSFNTAVGSFSMGCNLYGSKNTAIGHNSLPSLVDGTGNVSIGNYSLYLNKHKSFNVAIGHAAGYHIDKLPNSDQNYNFFLASYDIDYDDMCSASGTTRTDIRPLLYGKLSQEDLKLAVAPNVNATGLSLHDEGVLQVGGNVTPTASGRIDINNDYSEAAFDIGSRNYWWRDIYLDNAVEFIHDLKFNKPPVSQGDTDVTSLVLTEDGYIGFNTTNLHKQEGLITSKGSIIPESNNFYDLGTSTHAWRNAVITNLSIQNSILLPQLKKFYLASEINDNAVSGLFTESNINEAGLYLKSKDFWYDREYSISFLSPRLSSDTPGVVKPSLLINFNQDISDFSDNNFDVVNVNSALSTDQYKSGSQSLYLSGAGRQGIQTEISEEFSFGLNDFTIDLWIRPDSLPSEVDVYRFILDMRPTNANGNYVYLVLLSDGRLEYSVDTGGENHLTVTTDVENVVSALNWNHVALSRVDNVLKIFINGELAGTLNDTTSYLSQAFRFGHTAWTSTHYNVNNYVGYVDDIRIINGVGIFSNSFNEAAVTLTNVAVTSSFKRDSSWLSNISFRIDEDAFLKTKKIIGYNEGLEISSSNNSLVIDDDKLHFGPSDTKSLSSSGVYSSFVAKNEPQYEQVIEYKNPSFNGVVTQRFLTDYNDSKHGSELRFSRTDRSLDVNFIDGNTTTTVASFSEDKVTFKKGEEQFDIFDFVVEGYAKGDIDAPVGADFPTTGTMILKNSAWLNRKEINLVNRDTSLDISRGNYIIASFINGEYRPTWVSCDEADIEDVIPSGLDEGFLMKISNMDLHYIREDRIVSDIVTPDQEGVILKMGQASFSYVRQDDSPNPETKDLFAVFGKVSSGNYIGTEGFFYPLAKNIEEIDSVDPLQFRFEEFPDQLFYMPTGDQNIGVGTDGNYSLYTVGRIPTFFEFGVVVQENDSYGIAGISTQQPYTIGSSDFTIEFMIRPQPETFERLRYLFDSRPESVTNSTSISQGVYHSLVMTREKELLYNIVDENGLRDTKIITPTGVINSNNWFHVAVCRKNNRTKLFVDGVQKGSDFIDEYVYSTCFPKFFHSINKTPFDFESNDLEGLLLPSVITRVDGFYGHVDDILIVNTGLYSNNFTFGSLQSRANELPSSLSGIRVTLANAAVTDSLNNRALTFANTSIANDIVNPTAGNTGPSLFVGNSGVVTTVRSSYTYNLNNSNRIYISDARNAQENEETLSHYTFVQNLDSSKNHKITDIFTIDKPNDISIVGASFATPVVNNVPTTILIQVGTQAPDAPFGLLAIKGNQRVSLSWTAPSSEGVEILDYIIQFSSDSGNNWSTFADPVSSSTSAVVTGLTNGVSYIFRVAAVNRIGTGSFSTPSISVTPSTSAPESPLNLTGQPGNSSVILSWDEPLDNGGSPIINYSIQYTVDDGLNYTTVTTSSDDTSFTVINLVNGTNYKFRVAAINSVGVGTYSSLSDIIIPVNQLPSEPRTLTISRTGDGELTANWLQPFFNGGSSIDKYVVSYAISNSPNFTNVEVSGDQRSYIASGLIFGNSYVFKVAAENSFGIGPYTNLSDPVTIVSGAVPSPPTSVIGNSLDSEVALSWNPPQNDGGGTITDYAIQYRQLSKPNQYFEDFNTDSIVYVDSVNPNTNVTVDNLQNGASYKFKVSSKNYVGNSPFSNETADITPSRKPYALDDDRSLRGDRYGAWTFPSARYIFNNGNIANVVTTRVKLFWNVANLVSLELPKNSGYLPSSGSYDPGNGGSTITDFLINYSGFNNGAYGDVFSFNTGSVNTEAIITNLDTETDWRFTIQAINSKGTSDPTSGIQPTLIP